MPVPDVHDLYLSLVPGENVIVEYLVLTYERLVVVRSFTEF